MMDKPDSSGGSYYAFEDEDDPSTVEEIDIETKDEEEVFLRKRGTWLSSLMPQAEIEDSPSQEPINEQKLSQFRLFALCVMWFGRAALWATVSIILLPKQVITILGISEDEDDDDNSNSNYKGTLLGVLTLVGAVVGIFAFPLFGSLSDKLQPKKCVWPVPFGKRRPFMFFGALATFVSCVLLGLSGQRGIYWAIPVAITWAGLSFSDAVCSAPYMALIPDLVSKTQFGASSGWMGTMNMLGNITIVGFGFLVPVISVAGVYSLLGALYLFTTLFTIIFTVEGKFVIDVSNLDSMYNESVDCIPGGWSTIGFLKSMVAPFKDKNFRWVFWTRFLFTAGFQIVSQYLEFFLDDVVERPYSLGFFELNDPVEAASVFIGIITIGSLASALASGILSDFFGRKPLIYISGGCMSVVTIVLIFCKTYWILTLFGFVFGVGYGCYISVDFALVSDVLPNKSEYGKDMGVWHNSWLVPVVIIPPMSGIALDILQDHSAESGVFSNFGYKTIFFVATIFLVLAVVFISKVDVGSERRPKVERVEEEPDVLYTSEIELEELSGEPEDLSKD